MTLNSQQNPTGIIWLGYSLAPITQIHFKTIAMPQNKVMYVYTGNKDMDKDNQAQQR